MLKCVKRVCGMVNSQSFQLNIWIITVNFEILKCVRAKSNNFMVNPHLVWQFSILYNKIVIWIIKKIEISHMIIKMIVTGVYWIIIDTRYHNNQIIPVWCFLKILLEKTFNYVRKTSSINKIFEVGVVHLRFCDRYRFKTSGRRL